MSNTRCSMTNTNRILGENNNNKVVRRYIPILFESFSVANLDGNSIISLKCESLVVVVLQFSRHTNLHRHMCVCVCLWAFFSKYYKFTKFVISNHFYDDSFIHSSLLSFFRFVLKQKAPHLRWSSERVWCEWECVPFAWLCV